LNGEEAECYKVVEFEHVAERGRDDRTKIKTRNVLFAFSFTENAFSHCRLLIAPSVRRCRVHLATLGQRECGRAVGSQRERLK
jgi:hypothetical protein